MPKNLPASKRAAKVKATKEASRKANEDFGDDFFEEFAAEARGVLKEDVMVPTSQNDSLMEVNGWIPMPDDVCHVIDAKGIPCGLITTAFGLPDSGKTTFSNTALVNTQKEGGIAILFKTEDKYSLKRAAGMGMDVKKLMILRPKTIEQVGDYVKQIIDIIKKRGWEQRPITIVWDSLAATMSKAETDESRKDFSMDAAKAIRGMLRRVTALIKESNIAFIIVNQVYDNMNSFGEKTTQYGGKGVIYASVLMLKFVQVGRIRPPGKKSPDDFCGITTKIEVKKNHLGQPFKTGDFQIDWKGFVGDDRHPEYAPSYLKEEAEEIKDADPVENGETEDVSASDKLPEKSKKRTRPKGESPSP